MSDVAELMKRCQRGVGGRNALNDAHDIMAECYGTLGRLEAECDAMRQQRNKLAGLLREVNSAYTTAIHWVDMRATMAQIRTALSELTP